MKDEVVSRIVSSAAGEQAFAGCAARAALTRIGARQNPNHGLAHVSRFAVGGGSRSAGAAAPFAPARSSRTPAWTFETKRKCSQPGNEAIASYLSRSISYYLSKFLIEFLDCAN
jgi:hypothetical protein